VLIYKSGKIGYYKSYEYAKYILSKMKKIISFKAFSNEEHDYYEILDGKKNYYNLILFDDNSNEYWFDTKCGSRCMASIYSEKILNLVGIRDCYNIDSQNEIHKSDLSLSNKLNILAVEINLSSSIEKYFINSFIKLNFDDAYSRYMALHSLQDFGAIKPINEAIGKDLYVNYFDNYDFDKNIHDEYPINNILFVDKYLANYIKSNIGESIKNLLGIEENIYVRDINKMEYSIYGY